MKSSAIAKRLLAIGLISVMSVSAVACTNGKKKENNKPEEKSYTYNTYVKKGDDPMDTVKKYTEIGLVDVQIKEDGTWEWCHEMAENITDVTKSFADKEKWGIDAEATGRVWQINLNKNATFEEGTPITADTYIKSLGIVLMSEDEEAITRFTDAKNSKISISGAKEYSYNDRAGEDIVDTLSKCGYKSVDAAIAAGVSKDNIFINVVSAFGMNCDNETGLVHYQDETTQLVDVKGALGQAGAKVTAKELYEQLFAKGSKYEEYAKEYIYVPTGEKYQEVGLDTVGLVKVDDYTLYYITETSVSAFDFYQGMRTNWITYEATQLKETTVEDTDNDDNTENTVDDKNDKNNEDNKKEVYVSYGPYKLMAYRQKEVKLAKNSNWYGYTDGKHEGQYMTTNIVIDVLSSQSEIIQMYETGQLDYVMLQEENMSAYADSPNVHKRDTEYVHRWVFATELDDLIALEVSEGQGNNKRVLYYDDFRKAMSMAIDRGTICEIAGANYNSANYLINVSYYTDIANSQESIYRNQAEEVVAGLPLDDIEAAKTLFQSVYTQAVLNKNYTDGQIIQINCMVGDYKELTEKDKAEEKALNEMLAKATEGTGFDGKIKITYKCGSTNRYGAVADGEIEMIKSAWGGDMLDPFTLIRCYTDEAYVGVIQESCGWDPTLEKVTITYDFDGDGTEDTVAKTFAQWTADIQDDGVYAGDMTARAHILACLENGILTAYQCMPWGTETVWTLTSEKVKYGATSYNPMYEYGGVRHMTYNYDDKEWKNLK